MRTHDIHDSSHEHNRISKLDLLDLQRQYHQRAIGRLEQALTSSLKSHQDKGAQLLHLQQEVDLIEIEIDYHRVAIRKIDKELDRNVVGGFHRQLFAVATKKIFHKTDLT